MGDPQVGREFDSQTVRLSNSHSCKASKAQSIKADNVDVNYANQNMQDYFRSIIKRAADQRASQVLSNKTQNEFSDDFQQLCVLKAQVKDGSWSYQAACRRVTYALEEL